MGLFRGEKTLNDVLGFVALKAGEEELGGTEPVWVGNDRAPELTDSGTELTDRGTELTDRGTELNDIRTELTDRGTS